MAQVCFWNDSIASARSIQQLCQLALVLLVQHRFHSTQHNHSACLHIKASTRMKLISHWWPSNVTYSFTITTVWSIHSSPPLDQTQWPFNLFSTSFSCLSVFSLFRSCSTMELSSDAEKPLADVKAFVRNADIGLTKKKLKHKNAKRNVSAFSPINLLF